jgi:nucleoside-diphosphate-sugar epimerase
MRIFLTGGTGQIGSAVLPALLARGHQVTALARSDRSADQVATAGAEPVRGDLMDSAVVAHAAQEADGVIHVASPGDENSAAADEAVLEAVLGALADTDKPYVHTGGIWVHGSSSQPIDETTPMNPPQLTGWRVPQGEKVLNSEGLRGIVIAPGIVYGDGGGLPGLLAGGPRADADGGQGLVVPGTGQQHWTTVHVDDIGVLYALAVEAAPAGTYLLAAGGENPTVRELGEAASRGQGLGGRIVAEGDAATHERLGLLGEALLLDQQASGERARTLLGWQPAGRSLLDDLENGSYAAS